MLSRDAGKRRRCVAVGAARRDVAARGSAVAVRNLPRHRAHDAAAALLLLPGMRENTHRARQDEEPAAELRLEAELAENDCGDAIDVHRNVALPAGGQRLLDGMADVRVAARYRSGAHCFRDELEERRGARIDRMKAVTEAR